MIISERTDIRTVWLVTLEIGAGDFALAAGHRLVAVSLLAGTLHSAASFSIAANHPARSSRRATLQRLPQGAESRPLPGRLLSGDGRARRQDIPRRHHRLPEVELRSTAFLVVEAVRGAGHHTAAPSFFASALVRDGPGMGGLRVRGRACPQCDRNLL